MGWRELRGWLRALSRQLQAPAPDPGEWTDASRANFEDLDARRRALRGG